MIIKFAETESTSARNRTVNGIIGHILVNGSDQTIESATVADCMNKTSVKATLRRGGGDFVLFQDKLHLLALLSSLNHPFFPGIIAFAHKYASQPYPLASGDVYGEGTATVVPFYLFFGGPINLSGQDELILEVNNSSIQPATVNQAFLDFQFNDCIGVETFTPYTRFEAIPVGQNQKSKDLGNNVFEIAYINTDIMAVDATSSPINNWQLNSDKLSLSESFYDILCRRIVDSTDTEVLRKSYNNWRLYSGKELHNTRVDIELNSDTVNKSTNYLAFRFFYKDERLTKKAQGMEQKHAANDLLRVATSPEVTSYAMKAAEAGTVMQKSNEPTAD